MKKNFVPVNAQTISIKSCINKDYKNSFKVGWLVGWFILYHVNHCRLFNTIPALSLSLYIYIYIYISFGLVRFYGVSTIVGYLIPNPLSLSLSLSLSLYIYIGFGLVWFGFIVY